MLAPGPAGFKGRFVREIMCLPTKVVARSSTPTTAPTDTISLCVASLNTGRVFAMSPCGARTTILNLNVWGEEERKRTVLASSRERADFLYPLKRRKSIDCVGFQLICLSNVYFLIFFIYFFAL